MSSREIKFLSEQIAFQSSLTASLSGLSVGLAKALEKGDMDKFDELRERSESLKASQDALVFSNYPKGKN